MKKITLVFAVLLLMVSTAEANISTFTDSPTGYVHVRKAQPIQFMEKGIKFSVYPNGTFRFFNIDNTYHLKSLRKGYARTDFRHRNLVVKDHLGRVIRVNNIVINYNRRGNVTQIGSVDIDYNRSRMTQVGNLHILYNRYGHMKYLGVVKPRYNTQRYRYDYFNQHMSYDFDDEFFYDDRFYNDFEDYKEDDHYFYYRSKKDDKKVIKRKKIMKEKNQKELKRRS